MSKAILITSDNQTALANNFNVDYVDVADIQEVIPVGMYLMTEFGVTEHFVILTPRNLQLLFDRTGLILENGYFEVERNARSADSV